METMLYTIDHINAAAHARGEAILPAGVSVGAHVLDDCDTDTYGLEQAVDFIKGRTRPIDEILSASVLLPLQTSGCLFLSRASLRSPLQCGQGHVSAIVRQLMLVNGLG